MTSSTVIYDAPFRARRVRTFTGEISIVAAGSDLLRLLLRDVVFDAGFFTLPFGGMSNFGVFESCSGSLASLGTTLRFRFFLFISGTVESGVTSAAIACNSVNK